MDSYSPSSLRSWVSHSPETIAIGVLVLTTEVLVLLLYNLFSASVPTSLSLYIYPFVWINTGFLALWKVQPISATGSQSRLGLLVAGGYLLLLSVAGGVISPGHVLHGHAHSTGFRIALLPPGWGPALLYGGAYVNLVLMPFKTFGYLVLATLVYATVIEAAGNLLSGVVGLFSCVSCTFPVLAAIASGFFGSSSAVAAAVYSQSYGLSTAVFVLTVFLLLWRPSFL